MDMKYSSVQLTDLPDEILMIIFKKLDNIELLYSLIDVELRLNKILNESTFTNCLTLVNFVSNRLVDPGSLSLYHVYPLLDPILDRFCLHILPKIHQNVKWLDLEPISMERILLAANYPNLFGITLFNIQTERTLQLFSDERRFPCTYKYQISSLVIDIDTNAERERSSRIPVNANGELCSMFDMNTVLFTHIFTTFPNLRLLNFGPSLIYYQYLSFHNSLPTVISSTILELYVCLESFCDCLYLLDGRFNQLRTFRAHIMSIYPSHLGIDNKEKLPNLKSFTLYCQMNTESYDELILPLLHRMLNLEKLDLSLPVQTEKPFIDGNNLTLNIINHMPLLNKFTFNIRLSTNFYNEINIPSNEYIQQTFRDFQNEQIISSVDYFPESKFSQCHFYSYPYPYQLRNYDYITNNFPGGIFKSVRHVLLHDERPFEHEFFLQISQSFPLMERLTIINKKPQNRKSKDENEDLSIIEYPYLIELDLYHAHKDYHEQFLYGTKTCLPNNVSVRMDYRLAKKVTRNFRRNAARNNCAKMKFVSFQNESKFPDHIKDYFPGVESF